MWKVTATVQATGNAPVDMVWQKDGNEIDAMLCVAQLFQHNNGERDEFFPELLAIKIERVSE